MTGPCGAVVVCGMREPVSGAAVTQNCTLRYVRRRFACICGRLVRKKVGQISLTIPREVFRRSSYSSECSACCFPAPLYAAPIALRCWKHSRQKTGRPCVGRKVTVVSFPHCEQFVFVSERMGEV